MASVPAEIKNRWLIFISKPPAPRSPQNSEAQVSCQEIACRLRTRAKARDYIGDMHVFRLGGLHVLKPHPSGSPGTPRSTNSRMPYVSRSRLQRNAFRCRRGRESPD